MGLSFLSPLLLGGAALVAAPILLHLLMRRKPVPHSFPALRFLQARAVRNRRRLRLSHLLLLLLRIAAVLLVALALARPVLRGAGWLPDTEGPVAAAFVFDTAPRMAVRQGNQTRLDRARELADVLVEKLPGGSRLAVIDTSASPAAFAGSLAEAGARMERLDVTPSARSLPDAIAQARRLLASAELDRREIYVFTDCSQGAWEKAAAPDDDTGLTASVLYVDVAAETVRNYAVESLDLSGVRLAAGTPLVVEAGITATGTADDRLVDVEFLAADGRYVRRGVKPAAVGEAGRASVVFEIAGLEPGIRQGRVLLDGSDDLPADDLRSFTVEVGPPERVVVAAAGPADRNARLLVEAIAPTPLRVAGTARFAPEVIDYTDLDLAAWQGAEGVVLLDPPPLPEPIWEGLGRWVAEGHGLVVWLGPSAGGSDAFNTPTVERLLGGRIVRVWRSPDAGNYLAPTDLAHPLLAAFRRVGDEVPWQDFPVTRHWEFQPAEPAADPVATPAGVVVAYRNGLPAVTEHRVGQGRAVVVTTPVSRSASDPEAWNSLATGFEPWPFLILANETLLFSIEHAADRNVVTGRPAVLPLGRRDLPTATVRTPGGDDFPVAIDRDTGRVTVTATLEPGNYTVRAGGGIEGVSDGFSANLDSAATDFRRLSPDELATVLGPDHRLARDATELVRDVNRERVGTELFGWLILLAAAVMAADWIVANRFYAPRDEGSQPADMAAGFADAEPPDADLPEPNADGPPPLPARQEAAS
ncbi:MAG: hypothetical protein RLZZ440_2957 [Planctomycetota bacterium]